MEIKDEVYELFLECLFNTYMNKSDFHIANCVAYGIGDGAITVPKDRQAEYPFTCEECNTMFNFRKDCDAVTDKWYTQKIRDILKREGYID